MAEPRESTHADLLRFQPWMFIALVALAHILFCALVNPFGRFDDDGIAYLTIGAWYAQPMMFALWLALGTGSFSTRFQLTLLAFALLLLAGAITMTREDWRQSDDFPIRVAVFLVTAIMMLFLRRWMGWRIARATDPEINARGPVRFNTRSLLVWTAFCAAMLAISRYTWPFISRLRIGSLDEIALGTCIFGLVFGPLVFVSLSLLSTRLLSSLTVLTFIGWPIAVFSGTLVLGIVEPVAPDTIGTIFLVAAGGAFACCLTVLPVRLVGYRLMRPTSSQLKP